MMVYMHTHVYMQQTIIDQEQEADLCDTAMMT
jgi:hypothetical protein